MQKDFNIEEKYQKYLKMVRITEDEMSEVQRTEMRRTYFGAVGQFFIWLTNDFNEMEDDDCEKALDSIRQQTLEYWDAQAKQES